METVIYVLVIIGLTRYTKQPYRALLNKNNEEYIDNQPRYFVSF